MRPRKENARDRAAALAAAPLPPPLHERARGRRALARGRVCGPPPRMPRPQLRPAETLVLSPRRPLSAPSDSFRGVFGRARPRPARARSAKAERLSASLRVGWRGEGASPASGRRPGTTDRHGRRFLLSSSTQRRLHHLASTSTQPAPARRRRCGRRNPGHRVERPHHARVLSVARRRRGRGLLGRVAALPSCCARAAAAASGGGDCPPLERLARPGATAAARVPVADNLT